MRKTILTILGAALIVATSVQFAAAVQRDRGKATTRAVIGQEQTRHFDAYAAWPAPQVQPDSYPYSGWSAPAGH
jgi:hypothetical protein